MGVWMKRKKSGWVDGKMSGWVNGLTGKRVDRWLVSEQMDKWQMVEGR